MTIAYLVVEILRHMYSLLHCITLFFSLVIFLFFLSLYSCVNVFGKRIKTKRLLIIGTLISSLCLIKKKIIIKKEKRKKRENFLIISFFSIAILFTLFSAVPTFLFYKKICFLNISLEDRSLFQIKLI